MAKDAKGHGSDKRGGGMPLEGHDYHRKSDAELHYIMRETFLSSLEMASATLETLGEDAAVARASVKRFRQHDEATLRSQYEIKEDETKLIANAVEAAQQLEKLFEADAAPGRGDTLEVRARVEG